MTWAERRRRLQKSLPGRVLLAIISFFYGAAVTTHRWLYDLGILKRRRLDAKVICIGNLTAGGSGKTPAVMLAAHTLRQRNHTVAVVTRGYGRKPKNEDVLTLLDDKAPGWEECGDEPWMMHNALAGQSIPILVSPDKALAGTKAVTYYHAKAVVLDDGFQHHRLRRDLDILMVNALDPFGGRHLLPWGDLREPLSGLARAHMIVLTHVDRIAPEKVAAIKREIQTRNPNAPILESVHKTESIVDIRSGKAFPLDHLNGREVATFAGIADPAPFEDQIARLGASIVQRWRFPDHHPYSMGELQSIENARLGRSRGVALLTTSKDFPRLPGDWRSVLAGEAYVLSIKLDIIQGKNIWIDALCRGL